MSTTKFVDASATVQGTLVQSSWLNDVDTGTYAWLTAVAGTANNITAVGPTSLTTAYPTGVNFYFVPQNTSGGPATLNVNGLGAKPIVKYNGLPLIALDLVAGMAASVVYDGANFQLQNPGTGAIPLATGVVPIANGGTAATTAAQALSNLGATGRLINTQTFLTSGTYTPTAGTTRVLIKGQGAGGAGGGAPTTTAGQLSLGGGGGAGGVGETFLTAGFSGVTVSIGAGGVGASGATGGAGVVTSFGTALVLNGGAGGAASAPGSVTIAGGGSGGTASAGSIFNQPGANGANAWGVLATTLAASGAGAPSLYGGGGNLQILGASGAAGAAATGRGAGGSGAINWQGLGAAQPGGAGSSGIIIVYEYS